MIIASMEEAVDIYSSIAEWPPQSQMIATLERHRDAVMAIAGLAMPHRTRILTGKKAQMGANVKDSYSKRSAIKLRVNVKQTQGCKAM